MCRVPRQLEEELLLSYGQGLLVGALFLQSWGIVLFLWADAEGVVLGASRGKLAACSPPPPHLVEGRTFARACKTMTCNKAALISDMLLQQCLLLTQVAVHAPPLPLPGVVSFPPGLLWQCE